ncbi:MAG TPA: type II 3-dehydroquinate dehydratase [Chitinophagaceae bacterium]|nr:type II 3-dehydroquinate dehydratase [Chitinophagaceae bacterium]
MNIAIINGPNLNLLGTRETGIYGTMSFETFLSGIQRQYTDHQISYFQSNIEGELIDRLQQCSQDGTDAVLLNAGAYTHTSIALADAIAAIPLPVLEIHISNVLAREDFRKTSFIAAKCIGSISGLGLKGYELGIQYFIQTHGVNG